jgi:hypothetical protein
VEPLLGEHSQLIVAPHQLRVHHRTGTGNPALDVDQCCGSASLDGISDPTISILMPIHIRIGILPQVLHLLDNRKKKAFVHSSASLHFFIFLAIVIIFNILDCTVYNVY